MRDKNLKDCFPLLPHWITGPIFLFLVAQILFQYIGNFLSPSAKVGKTTSKGQLKNSTESNYLLRICCLEKLVAGSCGCWERPPQCERATLPAIEAMAEGAMLRGESLSQRTFICLSESGHSSVHLGYLRSGLSRQTCCLWVCFPLISCEWAQNHLGEASELDPASFTKSYYVTECCPSVDWFSKRKNPKVSFLEYFCTLKRTENVKPVFKKAKPLI